MKDLGRSITAKLAGLRRVSVRTVLGGQAEVEMEAVLTLSEADAARVRDLPEWDWQHTVLVFDRTSSRVWHVARFVGRTDLCAMPASVEPSGEAEWP